MKILANYIPWSRYIREMEKKTKCGKVLGSYLHILALARLATRIGMRGYTIATHKVCHNFHINALLVLMLSAVVAVPMWSS